MSTDAIVEVRATELKAMRAGGAGGATYRMTGPTTLTADGPQPTHWGPVSGVLVEVRTASGATGYGTVGAANGGSAALIAEQFAPLVIGRDPLESADIWQTMWRASTRFGQRGAAVSALAGIDIAIWDLKGKLLDQPVIMLLGGPLARQLPAYASRLYALHDRDELAQEARGYVAQGFEMVKQRFGYGPRDGEAGMRCNVELIRTVREAIGPSVALAADAYMGWDLEYAVRMERMLREYDLSWIEEPLAPYDTAGYSQLCQASSTPIAHGEHLSSRWDYLEVIRNGAASFLQLDANRAGGITESTRMMALAETFGVNVMLHSNEMHNVHLSFAHANCPRIEYFPPPPAGDLGFVNTVFHDIFNGNAEVVDGYIQAPTNRPGLGVTAREDIIDQLHRTSREDR